MSHLTSKLAKLDPFGKPTTDEDNEGEAIQIDSVAGGGKLPNSSNQARVSHAIKQFLVKQEILSSVDVNLDTDEVTLPLKTVLDRPPVILPDSVKDRSHPLTEYFVSSSHNTYLLAHQLYGASSPAAYETALKTGARCVEIDAWDNDDNPNEPKVTHGYTLASHIPFRQVCESIRKVVDEALALNTTPILISLENHCNAHGQIRLVELMKEIWGERLLSKPVRDAGTREPQSMGERVTLAALKSQIALIVEHHLPRERGPVTSSDDDEDEQVRRDHQAYREQRKKEPSAGSIIPVLAELGVYAQSVKPVNNCWFESSLEHGPHHHLINVSETGLLSLMPTSSRKVSSHNAQNLMRVFPKGTRISSRNLNPVPFWGIGAQITALNWQTFDHSMQLNAALFAGSDGYVLKPAALRAGGSGNCNTGRKTTLRLHVAGATDVHVPADREVDDEIRPYVTCTLVHPNDVSNEPPKRKTSVYRQHKLGLLYHDKLSPPTDPLWNESLEWEYEENELTFLRILIKSDDKYARNPVLAVAAVRLAYVTVSEWVFVRLLDLKGRESRCSLLLRFELVNA